MKHTLHWVLFSSILASGLAVDVEAFNNGNSSQQYLLHSTLGEHPIGPLHRERRVPAVSDDSSGDRELDLSGIPEAVYSEQGPGQGEISRDFQSEQQQRVNGGNEVAAADSGEYGKKGASVEKSDGSFLDKYVKDSDALRKLMTESSQLGNEMRTLFKSFSEREDELLKQMEGIRETLSGAVNSLKNSLSNKMSGLSRQRREFRQNVQWHPYRACVSIEPEDESENMNGGRGNNRNGQQFGQPLVPSVQEYMPPENQRERGRLPSYQQPPYPQHAQQPPPPNFRQTPLNPSQASPYQYSQPSGQSPNRYSQQQQPQSQQNSPQGLPPQGRYFPQAPPPQSRSFQAPPPGQYPPQGSPSQNFPQAPPPPSRNAPQAPSGQYSPQQARPLQQPAPIPQPPLQSPPPNQPRAPPAAPGQPQNNRPVDDIDLSHVYWLRLDPNREQESLRNKVDNLLVEKQQNGRDVLVIPINHQFQSPEDVKRGFMRAVRVRPEAAPNFRQLRSLNIVEL